MEKHIPEEEQNKKEINDFPEGFIDDLIPFSEIENYDEIKTKLFCDDDYPFQKRHEFDSENMQRRKEDHDNLRKQHEEFIKHSQEITNLGYVFVDGSQEVKYSFEYQNRLKLVLGQRQISHLTQIPQYCEQYENITSLQLLSSLHGITKIDPSNDLYHQELTSLLDDFEKKIPFKYFTGNELDSILKNFVVGNINDPQLFYRFENLKAQSLKYQIRRIFLYGSKTADDILNKKNVPFSEYLSSTDMRNISVFLKFRGCTISDVEPDLQKFYDKVKKSYIHTVKTDFGEGTREYSKIYGNFASLLPDEDLYATLSEEEKIHLHEAIKNTFHLSVPGRWNTMLIHEKNRVILDMRTNGNLSDSDAYEQSLIKYAYLHGFSSVFLQTFLTVPTKDINSWFVEAKKSFIQDFISFADNFSWSNFSSRTFGYVSILRLPFFLNKIEEALSFYDFGVEFVDLKKKLINNVYISCQNGITSLKNKEKNVGNIKWEARKSMGYKSCLKETVSHIDSLYSIIEELDPLLLSTLDWKVCKEQYMQEYVDHHKNVFIENRIKNILTLEKIDIKDHEKIGDMIIKNGEDFLFTASLKHIQSKQFGVYSHIKSPITTRQMFSFIKQDALFKPGYATLLTCVYPDKKERKVVRSEIIKSIIKNTLLEIQKKLLSQDTFNYEMFHMVDPLIYRYKKYSGRVSDIGFAYENVQDQYLTFLEHSFKSEQLNRISKVDLIFEKQEYSKADMIAAYIEICEIVGTVHSYLTKFFHQKDVDLDVKIHSIDYWKVKNKPYEKSYSKDYLDMMALWSFDISDLHEYLSHDMLHHLEMLFSKVTLLKKQLWTEILSFWFVENASSGGKLNRIVEEELFKKFGIISHITNDHIQFIVDYILKNIETIIIHDMSESSFDGYIRFMSDGDLVKELLQRFIEQRKNSLDINLLGGAPSSPQIS